MASKYRKKFELPEGFYEILESYSREVLRDQPLDIVEFSYMYFKALEEVSHQCPTTASRRTCIIQSSLEPRLFLESYQLKNLLRRFHSSKVHHTLDDLLDETITDLFLFAILQGNLDTFDYPKKGKNIPPSKHDAPPKEIPPPDDQEGDEQAASYYDENGERIEQDGQQDYGDEQQYGEEQEYGDEMAEGQDMQQDLNQDYGEEGAVDYGEQDD